MIETWFDIKRARTAPAPIGENPMKKRWSSLLLALLCLTLTACGGQTDAGTQTPDPTASVSPSPSAPAPSQSVSPSPEPDPESFNPLTGLPMDEEQAAARPAAILLNNLSSALPQQGNSGADIIYEVVAEGGITRMLGVYQSLADVGIIGSVRSARPYYVELALGHDALLIHAGASEDGYRLMEELDVDHLDGVNGTYSNSALGLFWRDQDRMAGKHYAVEHSLVTSGEAASAVLSRSSFRLTHAEDYTPALTFAPDAAPQNGEDADTVTVSFSSVKTGVFRYDAGSGLYRVEQSSGPYIDGNTGEQIAVTNVLVLRADITNSGDSYGHVNVTLDRGEGWFACGGKLVPITWRKDGPQSPITYALEDGSPLVLGQGKSYVNIVGLTRPVSWA